MENGMTRTSWTEEEIAVLREALANGASSSEAAALLGTGRTRNSVIGFIHRHGAALGLAFTKSNGRGNADARKTPRHPQKIENGQKIRLPAQAKSHVLSYQRQTKFIHPQYGRRNEANVKAPHLPPPGTPSQQGAGPKRIVRLGLEECRYAVTPHDCGPGGHRFCGAAVADPQSKKSRFRSYCAEHAALVLGIGTPSEREAHKASTQIEGGPIPRPLPKHHRF